MITRVRVKNFRSLADIDVTLGPLTVLVGRNGAGKSAFLDVLRFVGEALQPGMGLEAAFGQRGAISSVRRREPERLCHDLAITVNVEAEDLWAEYGFVIDTCDDSLMRVKRESLRQGTSEASAQTIFEIENGTWKTSASTPFGSLDSEEQIPRGHLLMGTLSSFRIDTANMLRHLVNTTVYNFNPATLPTLQQKRDDRLLSQTGDNLASMLQRADEDGWLSPIKATLRLIVSDIKDVRVDAINDHLLIGLLHSDYKESALWFDLKMESSGTIRLLALLTALYQRATYPLIAIEEPELFLYPNSMPILAGVIKETALNHQVIVTTQSPDFISEFDVEQLLIAERKGGMTLIGPLLPEQMDAVHKQLFTTGDLLRIEGLRATPFEAVSAADV